MGIKSNLCFFFFLILALSLCEFELLIPSDGSPVLHTLIENRTLDLTFIGIEDEVIDIEQIESYFNFNESVFSAETPYGDVFSSTNFNLNINIIHSLSRDSLISQFFNQAIKFENSSDYRIHYKTFNQILLASSILKPVELNVYRILVINLAYNGSPFNGSNLYLNYSTLDHDTNLVSDLRPYTSYGVSFSLSNQPTIGLLVSSEPHFVIQNFPLYQKVISGELDQAQWNTYLIELIEQAIWCRFNPSPLFRYNVHQTVTLHLSLVRMDQNYSFNDIAEYLDQDFIGTKFEELLMISDIEIKTVSINATSELKTLVISEGETFNAWANKISDHLKNESSIYWDKTIISNQPKYMDELDLYTAILVGNESLLPYTPEHVGTTFYTSETSEFGNLALVTLNYNMIFAQNEGLTLATIHEVAHLFGLSHPHDYWHPVTNQVKTSWSWGYTTSPLTYLCAGYQWDYFDKLFLWREQIYSLMNEIRESNYDSNRIQAVYSQIEQGSFNSLNETLQEVVEIYQAYQVRIQFQNTNSFVFSILILTTCIIGVSVIFWQFQKRISN